MSNKTIQNLREEVSNTEWLDDLINKLITINSQQKGGKF